MEGHLAYSRQRREHQTPRPPDFKNGMGYISAYCCLQHDFIKNKLEMHNEELIVLKFMKKKEKCKRQLSFGTFEE